MTSNDSFTLLICDGTAMAYRAFYAIAELSTKAGVPTNAVYGFIKLLGNLQEQWKPTHACVVFDAGLPEARMAILPTYKAQRKEMPDSLRDQIERIKEYLAAADVATVVTPGEEADDLMASIVDWARGDGAKVLLATHDKDMFQLVDGSVKIVPTTKGGALMGADEVRAKMGVEPAQVLEFLALVGDSADNIPGVYGVGEKTAAKLLNQFGSLEAMWGRLGEIESEKLRQKLVAQRADVERNLRLMSLGRDLDVPREWGRYVIRKPDPSRVLPFLDRMEFHGMARAMRDAASQLF